MNAAIENVVLDFRTRCNADDKRSVGSWQNKSDSPTVVNPSDSFSRSAQKSVYFAVVSLVSFFSYLINS